MNLLDWGVVALYLVGLVVGGALLGRSQKTMHDYYLGGRTIRWWQSGLSTMATQLGAISFVSAPAFVALKEGGGLKWLAYEFGVPLAMILVMAIVIPVFHRAEVISIYEYLEQRFDSGTRTLVSLLFQIGRGLATGVAVLAVGLIVSTGLGISESTAILLIGAVTVAYDTLGGIRAVILTDVAQMLIVLVGIIVCAGMALALVGWDGAWAALDPARAQVLDFGRLGLDAEGTYAFWPMMVGGFFLYASYYGCDQSQVQRELSVPGVDETRKSLLFNAFGRFPVVLLYSLMGVFIGAVVATPGFLARAAQATGVDPAGIAAVLQSEPDRMVPLFILSYLPHGLIGFLFVAILAAFMSSLDSALNSMSAVTVRDFYQRYWKRDGTPEHYLRVSKLFTLFWGLFCIGFALVFAAAPGATRQTTIVLINAVGSILYGPILAAFVLGMLTSWAGPRAVKTGVAAGVALNLLLWLVTPISWLWWNLTGFAAAVAVAALLSRREAAPSRTVPLRPPEASSINWRLVYVGVGIYFLLIIGVSRLVEASV